VSLRLFAAVDLPDPAREQMRAGLQALRHALRRPGMDDAFRWVDVANLHLTLRFLGNVADDAVPGVIGAIERGIDTAPEAVALARLGTFPPNGRPRVVHVGVESGLEFLRRLRNQTDAALSSACHWQDDARPFAPHLTLARSRDRARFDAAEFRKIAAAVDWPVVRLDVSHVTLFRSVTLPSGPRYSVLARAALRSS